ncbi:MAG: hypothetical protein ABJE66_22275 [Deltaproteobacteria bacterium]
MSRGACLTIALAVTLAPMPAHAYEFWLRAQTIGQAYQLRDYQLVGPDLFLGRRRVTQTLALRITDVGDFAAARRLARLPEHGLRISWQSYLRVDHDFGDFTSGSLTLAGPIRRDAIDAIPELADSVAGLDLMYGYLQLDGLVDDRLMIQLGRVLADDGWGTTGIDGGTARYQLPESVLPISVAASAGLRVRASSPLGVTSYELDGTSGAGCQEYVEGPTPGTGSWKLIDRNRMITGTALASDYEYCPQRDVNQPTVGFMLATTHTKHFAAEVGYRRTWSDTVGLIGPVDRLSTPDLGLYPNEFGQAPATGVDEERLYARAHADFKAGGLAIEPYGDARYSILHAVLDRADAGVRLRSGAHVLEPAVEYYYPTFDGDSIFNAFSLEPTTDVRLGYRYGDKGPWRATADAWLRRYAHEDATTSFSGGGEAGVQRMLGAGWRGGLDALADTGYGGRRIGGTAQAQWRGTETVWVRGRMIVLAVAEDPTSTVLAAHYVTTSANFSTTWRVADTVALHFIGEADHDAIHALQTRAIAVVDLAYLPEP